MQTIHDTPTANESPVLLSLVENAQTAFSGGHLTAARDALQQALTVQPDTVELILFLGNVLFHLGDVAGAHREFLKACRIDPRHARAQLSLAAACLHQERFDEAEAAVHRAIALKPGDAAGHKMLGGLCLQSERFSEALRAYEQVLSSTPQDVETWLSQGRCHYMLRDYPAAIRSYRNALALEPKNEVAAENLAVVQKAAAAASTPSAAAEIDHRGDTRFAKFRLQTTLLPPQTYQQIKQLKIDLIGAIGQADSIRDFGGLWGVHGLYLLEGAKALRSRFAEMVDVTPIPQFSEKVAELRQVMPVEVKLTQGDFRDARMFHNMGPVEVSLLYEVLLHQDNSVEVMKNVASKTTRCICVAQPVMKEELFALPNGAVNLQFYSEELKDLLRYAGWWEKEGTTDRFTTGYWMWGQTISHLESIFYGYGWDVSYRAVYKASQYWNYAVIRFTPRK